MFNNQCLIPIWQKTEISSVFVRANADIIANNRDDLNQCCNDQLKKKMLETLWLTKYNARLTPSDHSTWTHIQFKNKHDLTMFMLKWG
jgi:hypothetical protein